MYRNSATLFLICFAAPFIQAQIPEDCLCPILKEVMRDPVIATDGYTYERSAIERWFKSTSTPRSPLTNLVLPSFELKPNINLRNKINALELLPEERALSPVLNPHILRTAPVNSVQGLFWSRGFSPFCAELDHVRAHAQTLVSIPGYARQIPTLPELKILYDQKTFLEFGDEHEIGWVWSSTPVLGRSGLFYLFDLNTGNIAQSNDQTILPRACFILRPTVIAKPPVEESQGQKCYCCCFM